MKEHVPLAPYTTFRLGGPARVFFIVHDVDEIKEALSFSHEYSLPILILGSGSNVLITEGGFDGVVIKIELQGITKEENKDGVVYIASAGESWDGLVERACKEGLWGVENLSGIPGTVGAAPIQNIGAYGSELKNTLLWVEALDTTSGDLVRLTAEECQLSYRTSVFKRYRDRYIIVRVAFSLLKSGTPNIAYRDLAARFLGTPPSSPGDIRDAVLTIRSGKFPDLSKEGTAGSFFLNPIVPQEKAIELVKRYPELPHFSAQGGIKLSLAWLLDHALNLKGAHVGGARLYEHQPLVIVTDKTATTSDVLALKEKIFARVRDMFNFSIDTEIRII